MILSDRLRVEREKHNWSQAELADKLNVTRQSVSKCENNKGLPSIEVFTGMNNILKNIVPLALIIVGAIGSDTLKGQFKD